MTGIEFKDFHPTNNSILVSGNTPAGLVDKNGIETITVVEP